MKNNERSLSCADNPKAVEERRNPIDFPSSKRHIRNGY